MFDFKQKAMRVEVFKDTMARIEADESLRQAVSRSIETQPCAIEFAVFCGSRSTRNYDECAASLRGF